MLEAQRERETFLCWEIVTENDCLEINHFAWLLKQVSKIKGAFNISARILKLQVSGFLDLYCDSQTRETLHLLPENKSWSHSPAAALKNFSKVPRKHTWEAAARGVL